MKKLFFYLFAIMAMVACSDDSSTEGGGNNGGNNGGGQTTQASLTVSPTNVDFSTDGGTSKVTITSTAEWTASLVNNRADDWCSIDSTSGSAGTSTLTITATANDTPDDRSASVVVKSGSLSKTINVSQKQKDALTVTSSKFEVDAEGGEVVVEVKANIDFEYAIDESAKDWISHEGTRAIQTSTLVFKVAKNDDTEKREGTITIKSGEFSEEVMIYQAGEEPSIVISQDEYTVSSDGETIAVEVSSNVDVAVEIPEDVDWIKESTTRATSTNTYYFDITKNEDYDQRSAEICFTNKENNLSEGVTITQVQKDALVVAKDSYTVDSEGDEIIIEVGHNIDFDIEISDDWITRKETRAFNTDKLTFVIAENKGYDNREGTIVFKSKDGAISQIVKVYQAQEDALIISKKDIVVSAESGTISFELQTNVEFKVSEPNVNWLRAVTTRGLTTHTLHYEYDANTSYDSREAQIIVTDTKNNKSETITITQAQKDAIVLAKDSYVVESEGGQIQIEVGHNIDFKVEISADWITKVDTRAFVTETLNFNIAKNPTNNNREGTIIFTSKNNTLSQKLKIIQNPHELQCVYVATKGTLSHILNELGLVPCDIHEIKISGYLNDEDFLIIREDMSSLEYLDISDVNITTLPAKALYKSTSIKTLLLPKTLLEIRENVFAYSHIQEVVIPQGVSRIGDSAFYNCDYLSSISFPSSVEVIEPNAFADCSSLYNIKFEPESKIRTIDGEFIVRDISTANNPYKYEYKYNGAFANCDKLGLDPISNTHIPIFFPASLETIGAGAFYDCDNLSQVLFDNKSQLKSINGASHDAVSCGAFEGCKITSINIPSSVEFIGEYSFYNCTALSSLIFEADSSLEIIGKNAFRNTSIKTLSIPSKVEIIDIGAFCDCDITSLVFMPSSNLKQINGDCGYNNAMNQNVKYDGAFANNPIATINFPASLEEIGPASFYNCKKLSIISFEKNSKLTKIEGGAAGAFMNTNLQTVDMSNCTNIKYLGPWIFYNISTLRLVKIGTITPPDTNYQKNSFYGIAEVAVLKVPTESIDAYKNSWMKTNFDSITGLDE